jgi:hypothetical protein
MLPVKNKFRTEPSVGEVMSTLFWEAHSPILDHCWKKDTAVQNGFMPVETNHLNRIGLMLTGLALLHNYAYLHTCTCTIESRHVCVYVLS